MPLASSQMLLPSGPNCDCKGPGGRAATCPRVCNAEVAQLALAFQRYRQDIAGKVFKERRRYRRSSTLQPSGGLCCAAREARNLLSAMPICGAKSATTSLHGVNEGVIVRVNQLQPVHADVNAAQVGAFHQRAYLLQRVQYFVKDRAVIGNIGMESARHRHGGRAPAGGAYRRAGLPARGNSPGPAFCELAASLDCTTIAGRPAISGCLRTSHRQGKCGKRTQSILIITPVNINYIEH